MTNVQVPKVRNIVWNEFQEDVDVLIDRLHSLGKWEGIIAISRGGLVPAVMISHGLGIQTFNIVRVKSYTGIKQQGEIEILDLPLLERIQRSKVNLASYLVIDDLVDSGSTMFSLRSYLFSATFATVYAKPNGLAQIDVFARQVEQDVWLNFPWETVHTSEG
jgi:xanthine phosphoribosyltransferase